MERVRQCDSNKAQVTRTKIYLSLIPQNNESVVNELEKLSTFMQFDV